MPPLRLLALLGAIAAAAATLTTIPPVGATVSFEPTSNLGVALRHCDYVCSVDKNDGSEDFLFVVAAPLNGDTAPGALSFLSSNFPDHALSPIAGSGGKVGVNTSPDADDATWLLAPGRDGSGN